MSRRLAFLAALLQTFVVEMVGREDLHSGIALNSILNSASRVLGPAAAGIALVQFGTVWCFFLNGLSFIAVIAGLLMMRLPKFVPPAEPVSTGRHVVEGFAYVAGHRRLRILLLLFGVVGIFGWSYSVLLPAYATDLLHVGEGGYGALLSANGAVSVAPNPVIQRISSPQVSTARSRSSSKKRWLKPAAA